MGVDMCSIMCMVVFLKFQENMFLLLDLLVVVLMAWFGKKILLFFNMHSIGYKLCFFSSNSYRFVNICVYYQLLYIYIVLSDLKRSKACPCMEIELFTLRLTIPHRFTYIYSLLCSFWMLSRGVKTSKLLCSILYFTLSFLVRSGKNDIFYIWKLFNFKL